MIAATFKRALRGRRAAILATLLIALLAAGGAQAAKKKKKKKEQSLVAGTVMNQTGETLSDVSVKILNRYEFTWNELGRSRSRKNIYKKR